MRKKQQNIYVITPFLTKYNSIFLLESQTEERIAVRQSNQTIKPNKQFSKNHLTRYKVLFESDIHFNIAKS